jgi:hypothetical protein
MSTALDLLRELRSQGRSDEARGQEEASPPSVDPFGVGIAPVVATREQIGAVLLRTRFGEIWVVLESSMVAELVAEEAGRADPRPVLLAEDVARLRRKSEEMIRAALAVLATFPSVRLIQ